MKELLFPVEVNVVKDKFIPFRPLNVCVMLMLCPQAPITTVSPIAVPPNERSR
jgi:hypothetical protein